MMAMMMMILTTFRMKTGFATGVLTGKRREDDSIEKESPEGSRKRQGTPNACLQGEQRHREAHGVYGRRINKVLLGKNPP